MLIVINSSPSAVHALRHRPIKSDTNITNTPLKTLTLFPQKTTKIPVPYPPRRNSSTSLRAAAPPNKVRPMMLMLLIVAYPRRNV